MVAPYPVAVGKLTGDGRLSRAASTTDPEHLTQSCPQLLVAVIICVADVFALRATGNGDSGANDSSLQIVGFLTFIGSAAAALVLSAFLGIRWSLQRRSV